MDMAVPGRIPVSEGRRKFLESVNPWVRFEIPSDMAGQDYRWLITHLLAAFVLWANPEKNKWVHETVTHQGAGPWNKGRGGISNFWVKDGFVTLAKMEFYDGNDTEERGNPGLYKGVMFLDHRDGQERYSNTVRVLFVADAFEEFLRRQGIRFIRYNWPVDGSPVEVANTTTSEPEPGLSPENHLYLNNLPDELSDGERRKVFAAKRAEYAGNPRALRQIDVYDRESEYHEKLREYVEELKKDFSFRELELQIWFSIHYADIG